MLEIKPIDKEVVKSIIELIGDAEVMDGSPIDVDKVTGVTIKQTTVVMVNEEYPFGMVIYSTTTPWDFFVNALKKFES